MSTVTRIGYRIRVERGVSRSWKKNRKNAMVAAPMIAAARIRRKSVMLA